MRRAVRSAPLQGVAAVVCFGGVAASLLAASGLEGVLGSFLALLMIAIALIDARYFMIPNELTATAAGLALLRAGFAGSDPGLFAVLVTIVRALGAALPFLILMLAYRKWRGRDGLGLGDVKLAAVAGLWLGWEMVFVVVETATLAAIAAYFIAGFYRGRSYRAAAMLPFGLFLAPAIWIGWFVGILISAD